ncbi:hypothetical protein BHE74_00011027 [Ensete ventricosum]|uniref:Uncharacterized protein n=1 Tax=Ensete ventricosum TaxID=4639 RepID=A0A444CR13_ENSVE|nr:hypothetical protein B296_00020534 [Ensete ventricosum]RWV88320.1 hypothetical protein GW17_00049606 [Ensete ventricosum]RWW80618.1 hypothetical protein BHE74_00011027 [Ensete ventricosum]RZR97129.1 hypothetical protein BHM03_00026251 [Ensete ventricosum]
MADGPSHTALRQAAGRPAEPPPTPHPRQPVGSWDTRVTGPELQQAGPRHTKPWLMDPSHAAAASRETSR